MKIPRYFPFNEIISNHFKLYSYSFFNSVFFRPHHFCSHLFVHSMHLHFKLSLYTSQIDSKIVVLYEIALISCRIHRFFDSTFVLSEHLKYSNIFPKCYYMHTCIHAYDVIGKLERCIKFKSQCRIYS